ncbi:MAG: hypothetical protein ACOX85_10965 [Candidatus Pararuminococcus gallinarum]|jgi:hypothetical protein
MSNGSIEKDEDRLLDGELLNRFIIFYMLRCLWKYNKHEVEELYQTVGINRTLYTRILNNEEVEIADKFRTLEQITGIKNLYWDGKKRIRLNNWDSVEQEKAWESFCRYRRKRSRSKDKEKTDKEKVCEADIKRKIESCTDQTLINEENHDFRMLFFFARYKQREPEKTAEKRIEEVGKAMADITQTTLEHVSEEILVKHVQKVMEYNRRVQAVLELKKWKF